MANTMLNKLKNLNSSNDDNFLKKQKYLVSHNYMGIEVVIKFDKIINRLF